MVLSESAPRRAPQAHCNAAWAVIRATRAPQAQERGSCTARSTSRSASRREGDGAGEAVRGVAPETREEYGI